MWRLPSGLRAEIRAKCPSSSRDRHAPAPNANWILRQLVGEMAAVASHESNNARASNAAYRTSAKRPELSHPHSKAPSAQANQRANGDSCPFTLIDLLFD